VFPNGSLWLVGAADLLLVASTGDLAPKLAEFAAGFNRGSVADDLRLVAVENAGLLLDMYSGGPEELRSIAADAIVQNDDRMALEFSAPRGLVERGSAEHALDLRRVSRTPPLLRAAVSAGRESDATTMLVTAARDDSYNVPVRIGLSRLAAARGDLEMALSAVQPLMRDLPLDPRAYDQAAAVLADAGDLPRLREVAQYQQERWPERAQTAHSNATVAMFEGRFSDAYQTATSALATFQGDARLYNTAGAAAARLRRMDDARRHFEAALAHAPRDPTVYINLGLLEFDSGNADGAARRFAEALLLEPDSAAAREGLSRAEGAMRR
jgi:Flp pilus assembly protein TadD